MTIQHSETLIKFPILTKGQAENIEYEMRHKRGQRITIELNGVYYDIRKMTDEEAEKVYQDLSNKNA